MASLLRASALGLTLAVPALAQFVKAPTDLTTTKGYLDLPVRWKEVPEGTCELTPDVKSYSGYVDIEDSQHIFFWFFEARDQKPEDAELTVWINGGPGSSSMIGLFEELGPCRVDIDGNVVNNPYAWNNVSNMLFIDHPAQVGFSYSTPIPSYISSQSSVVQLPNATCPEYAADLDCATRSQPVQTDTANSTSAAAPSMWKTLQGFMGAFPQYSRTEFNFATESYGGHYGPIFNAYIESQNKLIKNGSLPGAKNINLRTVLIGNGWYDPLIQYQAYYNFTVYPGNTYDYYPYNKSVEAQIYNALYGPGNCYDQTVACNTGGLDEICSAADSFCANEIETPLDNEGRDEYDIRELTPDPFPYSFYTTYLNSEKLQQAIGAYVNFTSSNQAVGSAFGSTGDDDREDGTIEATRSLVEQGIYVVQFAGDADYNCNWLGGEVIAHNVEAPGFGSAGYTNITTSDKVVHGQVKQSANFAFARIYESGHEVPFYQPLVALEMFNRSIHGLDIASGEQKISRGCEYKTVGTPKSEYREGNATVQFKVLPANAIYNTTLNGPNPTNGTNSTDVVGKKREATKRGMFAKQSLKSKRTFKPTFGRKMK
ncbi:hypothetical protein DOTSEDRAFT_60392 [Dothistroma septosporum NZE10]|uniref:Uncharacterized protein n=1 Tax=Dothistroma septosporum (strain NZE10 / CBS 128990) TaxID=675120 RepID=N1Q0N6_DOTSN|nr:hypothetical protein DOTSEDRAFT_60392 [Dothistroma septosporum NZE10]